MNKTILIVDDDLHIRVLLGQIFEDLEEYGVELVTATNGKEAIEAIKKQRVDLIFLDVMMPIMNGYEVCEKIKNDPSISSIYVILLTAKGQQVDRTKAEEVKADEYITKPFDPDLILEKAKTILGIA